MAIAKERIVLFCDRALLVCVYLLMAWLPVSSGGVETCAWAGMFFWFMKKAWGYQDKDSWKKLFPRTVLNRTIVFLTIAKVLSTIYTVNSVLSVRGLLGKELKFIAVYFMVVEVINSYKRLQRLLAIAIMMAAIMVADAGTQYFYGKDFLRGYEWSQLRASFPSTNDFAGWLIMMIFLFSGVVLAKNMFNRKIKFFTGAVTLFLLSCLLITFSRGGWIGLLFGGLIFLAVVMKHNRLRSKIILVSVLISMVACALILPQSVKTKVRVVGNIDFKAGHTITERLKSMADIHYASNVHRLKLWNQALWVIRDFPLTGSGLNTYSFFVKKYPSFEGGSMYPHNSFLQMTAETGFLGLIMFLWLLISFLIAGFGHVSKKNSYLSLGMVSGIIAFLVQSFFDTNLYALQLVVLFWYMLGLTIAVMRIEE
ncbi:MAG: O-antigen ligase family protein [Candidatus Omnitrophota bacterium]|jgi:O-antigen ligase